MKKGRQIIGWDEIIEGGLAPNATVMSWRGEKGGIEAARLGHDVIMTPGKPLYFDHGYSKSKKEPVSTYIVPLNHGCPRSSGPRAFLQPPGIEPGPHPICKFCFFFGTSCKRKPQPHKCL